MQLQPVQRWILGCKEHISKNPTISTPTLWSLWDWWLDHNRASAPVGLEDNDCVWKDYSLVLGSRFLRPCMVVQYLRVHVTSCWFRRPYFLGILHPLWILHSFCLLFSAFSSALRESIWSLHNVWLWASVLHTVFWRRKILWWGQSNALMYR